MVFNLTFVYSSQMVRLACTHMLYTRCTHAHSTCIFRFTQPGKRQFTFLVEKKTLQKKGKSPISRCIFFSHSEKCIEAPDRCHSRYLHLPVENVMCSGCAKLPPSSLIFTCNVHLLLPPRGVSTDNTHTHTMAMTDTPGFSSQPATKPNHAYTVSSLLQSYE